MKSRLFRAAILFSLSLIIPLTIGLGGCASKPPERPDRPDSDKIQQDSEKGMQDLQKEEDRRGNGY